MEATENRTKAETTRRTLVPMAVILSSISLLLLFIFSFNVSALEDQAENTIDFSYPNSIIINETEFNVNNSDYLDGYHYNNLPYGNISGSGTTNQLCYFDGASSVKGIPNSLFNLGSNTVNFNSRWYQNYNYYLSDEETGSGTVEHKVEVDKWIIPESIADTYNYSISSINVKNLNILGMNLNLPNNNISAQRLFVDEYCNSTGTCKDLSQWGGTYTDDDTPYANLSADNTFTGLNSFSNNLTTTGVRNTFNNNVTIGGTGANSGGFSSFNGYNPSTWGSINGNVPFNRILINTPWNYTGNNRQGLYVHIDSNPTTNGAGTYLGAMAFTVYPAGSYNKSEIRGVSGYMYNGGDGNIVTATAFYGALLQNGGKDSKITTATNFLSGGRVYNNGIITNHYGFYSSALQNANTTNTYAFWNDGVNDFNIFKGNTTLGGSTKATAEKVRIDGEVKQYSGNITIADLAGSGNAYACLDSTGKLYRSATACA